jgi:hypothetical protein
MRAGVAPTQRGAALIVMLALVGVVAGALMLQMGKAAADRSERDRITALALGRAVEALVARAATDGNRPGSLPCPDTDNDGIPNGGGICSGAPHIGRLPWATLDLPDLRDGDGERLWYALSPAFRDDPGAGPAIHSDTAGELQVTGAAPVANAVAIVFAAGTSVGNQNRDAAGENTLANYLEDENADGDDTYENGPRSGTFNDQLLVLTADDLMPAVERRVAREAKVCLMKYAAANGGRFPWAAPLNSALYDDTAGTLAGRLPRIVNSSGAGSWTGSVTWPSSGGAVSTLCIYNSLSPSWWDRWRGLLFYQVAAPFAPSGSGVCGTDCLVVNGTPSVQAVVVVAGRAFPAQTGGRPGSDAANYLEEDPVSGVKNYNNYNGAATGSYVRLPRAASFNDQLECIHASGAWPCGD